MKKVTSEEKEKLQAMLERNSEEAAVSELMASGIRRFMNYTIDWPLLGSAIVYFVKPMDLVLERIAADWLYLLYVLVVFVPFPFLYYFVFETVFQRTPAKLITNTKVVMLDGSKPSGGTIAKRTLIRIYMPFAPFFFWHDRWSKTEVVKVSWSWLDRQTRWKRFLISFFLFVVKVLLLSVYGIIIVQRTAA